MCFTATRKQVNYDSSWSGNNWGRITALLFGVQQDFLSYLGKTSYQSCNSTALRYTYLSQAHWVKASKVSTDKWSLFLSLWVNKLFIRDFSRTHHYKNKVGNWALWPNFEKQRQSAHFVIFYSDLWLPKEQSDNLSISLSLAP